MTIVSAYSSLRDWGHTGWPKLYKAISLENEWCVETQRYANTNGLECVRSGDKVYHCKAYDWHLNAIGVRYARFSTRLLTLVQVGDSWEYAQEAIIKWLLSYSKFMINV